MVRVKLGSCVDGKEGREVRGLDLRTQSTKVREVEERCVECGLEGILNVLSRCVVMYRLRDE